MITSLASTDCAGELVLLKNLGFCIVSKIYSSGEIENLRELLESEDESPAAGRRLFGNAWLKVREAACTKSLMSAMTQALTHQVVISPRDTACPFPSVRLIRATLFDKTPGTNWKVPWHQDLTIPLDSRPDSHIAGYGPWTTKAGIPHVQRPCAPIAHRVTA